MYHNGSLIAECTLWQFAVCVCAVGVASKQVAVSVETFTKARAVFLSLHRLYCVTASDC